MSEAPGHRRREAATPPVPPLLGGRGGSRMAERTALQRAAHQLLDPEPRIFTDPLALRILGPRREQWLREHLDFYTNPQMLPVRWFNAVRSRYAEEQLAAAVARGVRQYVILGAGLDTFGYRNPFGEGLRVFEVDHPATQAFKRECLAEAGIDLPACLRFAGTDFNLQSPGETLQAAGFDRGAPAFFAWMGVSYYLTEAAVAATLRYIGGHPPGSGLAFDFALSAESLSAAQSAALAPLLEHVAREGEPWLARFSPGELARHLRAAGFTDWQTTTPEAARVRYGAPPAGGTEMPFATHFVTARI